MCVCAQLSAGWWTTRLYGVLFECYYINRQAGGAVLFSNIFVVSALLVVLGSTISTMAGFGFGIVTIPFLLIFYPAKVAIALNLVVAASGAVIQWYRVRRQADYGLVARLCAGVVVGLPLGGLVITAIDPALLKALIGLAVLSGALLTLIRSTGFDLAPRQPGLPFTMSAGLAAGLLSTTVGQPGLAVASFMAWTRWDKTVVRATLYAFFVFSHFGSLVTLAAAGTLTREVGWTGISLVPFYFLGILLGDIGFRRSTQAFHRQLTMAVMAVAALLGLYNGVSALIG